MELSNKRCRKMVIKGINKFNVSSYILDKLQVKSNINHPDNINKIITLLQSYSKKPTNEESSICNRDNWNLQKKYKLAIILPVYNGEKFIIECLDSLLNQKTKYNYQIILVNDGSTDGTSKIINKYVSNSKIKYIEQKNRGHSGARNKGLEVVNAEYISFVDADDYVSNSFIQTLIEKAEMYGADIIQGGFQKFMSKGGIRKKISYKEEIIENNYIVSGFPWAKIFRASLFERIQFPEGYWYEDSIMSHLIYPLAKKIVTIPEIVYFYRVNLKGISRTSIKYRKCIDSSWVLGEMLICREALGLKNDYKYLELFLDQIIINFRREFNVDENIKKLVCYYNCYLYDKYFVESGSCFELSEIKQKLSLALKNKDYVAYKTICTFYK